LTGVVVTIVAMHGLCTPGEGEDRWLLAVVVAAVGTNSDRAPEIYLAVHRAPLAASFRVSLLN
jgi:hypothetical protein